MGQTKDTDSSDSSSIEQHRGGRPLTASVAIITISDTRTLKDDTSGALIAEKLEGAGHRLVARTIVPDEPTAIASTVRKLSEHPSIDCLLLTGGTGISPRDRTYETLCQLLTKPMPGYGELFRMLSYEEIGAAAMLSRTVGGLIGNTIVLTMPGSRAAVRLAMEKLILPELSHLLREATK